MSLARERARARTGARLLRVVECPCLSLAVGQLRQPARSLADAHLLQCSSSKQVTFLGRFPQLASSETFVPVDSGSQHVRHSSVKPRELPQVILGALSQRVYGMLANSYISQWQEEDQSPTRRQELRASQQDTAKLIQYCTIRADVSLVLVATVELAQCPCPTGSSWSAAREWDRDAAGGPCGPLRSLEEPSMLSRIPVRIHLGS